MKVFCDVHHEELFESLRILFEERFGFELYRPVGRNWFDEGYWKLSNIDIAVRQFLELSKHSELFEEDMWAAGNLSASKNGHRRYFNIFDSQIEDGIFYVRNDVHVGQKYKGITLEAFKNTKFDIMVATLPEHIVPYQNLISKYQPRAKLIFQMGNPWKEFPAVANVLNSTSVEVNNCHHLNYNQEFKYNGIKKTYCGQTIYSLTHNLLERDVFLELEKEMSDWTFRMHGFNNRDGFLGPELNLINDAFGQQFSFLWHVRKEGEGFGYCAHRAMAYGRPIIINSEYVRTSKFYRYMKHRENCIDICGLSIDEIKLEILSANKNYDYMSENMATTFKNNINYDEEFIKISKFINNLI